MSLQIAPDAFTQLNGLQSKELVLVVDIAGVDYLTTRSVYQVVRYGDPVNYGDPDLVYGGMRLVGTGSNERAQRSLVMLDGGSLTISQRLEPEQGRGAISTLSMSFLDKDEYMTKVVSPGIIVDEILGREVKIWLGYVQNSFPEEYYVVWRGRITQVNIDPGRVTLQFSDPNIGRRQQIFYSAKTTLRSTIGPSDVNLSVAANGDFHKKILGPDGTYSSAVKCYLKIKDELIEYQQTGAESTGFGSNQFLGVLRGQRGTTATSHAAGDEIQSFIEISDGAIQMALKLMLSGWNGPFVTGAKVFSFNQTTDPAVGLVSNGIMLPIGVDAVRDYGIQAGDFITVSGAGISGNNGQCRVIDFLDAFDRPNQVILTDKTFAIETGTSAVMSMRSQFDVYPTSCGVKLPPKEVDVGGHLYYLDTFLGASENAYRFFIGEPTTCKEFIETEIFLPLGCYSLTRQGKLSVGLTKPPIADQRTVTLDSSNIIDPQNIRPSRGTNNRKFFNEIDWVWDFDDSGNSTSTLKSLDGESLSLIGILSILPITSKGSRTDIGFLSVVEKRSSFLLQRYSRGAVLLTFKTFFGVGNQIEAGDVVLLRDEGNLQIPNMNTGARNMGVQLMEVIDRQLDIKSGAVQLTLQGGLGVQLTDRYATIAPSSLINGGSTTSRIRIKESFGALYPTREFLKWKDYAGLKITVHNNDWSFSETVKFLGFAPDDDHAMIVDPPLSIVPPVDYVVELESYPDTTDATDQAVAKLIHAYLSKTVSILTGVSTTQFNINMSDAAYLYPGAIVRIHDQSFAQDSGEVAVDSIVGTLVTVSTSMGFTPSVGMRLELVPFKDQGLSYRFV